MNIDYINNCINKLQKQLDKTSYKDEWNMKFLSDKLNEFQIELYKRGVLDVK